MGGVRNLAASALLLLSFLMPAHAQEARAEWHRLNQEIIELYRQGKYDRAVIIAKMALEIAQQKAGPDHPDLSTSLNNLAELYSALGAYAQAEPLYKRALDIDERTLGIDHPDVATNLNNLALLYRAQGAYAQAEPLQKRALAIYEKAFGPEHPQHSRVAATLNNLAGLYGDQGAYARAEPLHKRALAIYERTLGPDHPDVATSLNNLALLYGAQGAYAQAEPLQKRAQAIYEKALGTDHPLVATSLNNLAKLYSDQGAYVQAEPLQKRALAIYEKALGPDHPSVASNLNNLAVLYTKQGAYAKAEPLHKRALGIREKTLGPDHPDVATSLNNLAGLYSDQGAYARAEPLHKSALAIYEKALGPDHPAVASNLNNLAMLYTEQGAYAKAEPLHKRALYIREKALGPDHPDVAISLNNLAWLIQMQSRTDEALNISRSGYRILRNRFLTAGSDSTLAQSERQSMKWRFIGHIDLLAMSRQSAPAPDPELIRQAFETSQLAQVSSTGEVVARMAARFAAGSDSLAQKVRERQDLILHLQKLDADLLKAASLVSAKRNAALEQQLRSDSLAASNQLGKLDDELAKDFPAYAELTSPTPLTIAETQKLLGAQEALLSYVVSGKATYLFVLRADRAELFSLPVGFKTLNDTIKRLRHKLDPVLNPNVLAFDVKTAHELYLQLLAPAEPYLAGATHVMLVLDGALQSMPFSILVSKAPKTPIVWPSDHKRVDWLARRFAFTTLPSVSALRALRTFANQEIGKQPFVGFGDPILEGEEGREKRLAPSEILTLRNVADVEVLRKAARLPETATELKTLARILNASENQIFLQERSTETTVKKLDLSDYRTVAFSTHGVMAGQLKGISEPGLVLTPPTTGTELDDGYLTASEVAKLRLKADWVLLSACNTAASDGTPGADGLTGLAKAFFYAGARSLLVSHWSVDSDATLELQTAVFREFAAHPEAGKAAALRHAMLAVMNSGKNPHHAHPFYWAPFVVVGEGIR